MDIVVSNQIKSQRAGMTMDSSNGLESFPCPGFSVWTSSLFKKKSHQQFFVKREVPCHTTKFEPCLTFGPPSYKIYPVMFIFYNSFHFFLEKPDIVEKPQLATIIFQREKLIHSKTGYRCKSDMPCNTYERLL